MIKAAAYCRVSTEKEEQLNSLDNQQKFFCSYIEARPDWQLTEIYVDEGVSGTAVSRRQGFLKMLADGEKGRFQILLTKEISRFARNTLDSIYYTRKLKDWGIGVIFLNDNINTLDPDAELRLTIMSSIAQEESRKTSERVKWGQRRQMEKGVVFGHSLLGYTLQQGKLEVEAAGAAVVRQIFEKFVIEEKGSSVIAQELTAAGVPTPGGGEIWSHNVVLKILRNRKYMGDLVQKKTYTPSYLTHKKKINRGEEPMVILEQHHKAIIPPQLFAAAEEMLKERGRRQREGSRYSHEYCFSGKLHCACCGSRLVARPKKKGDKTYLYWQCYGKIKRSGNPCSCPTLAESYLESVLLEMMTAMGSQEMGDAFTSCFADFYRWLGQILQRGEQENQSQGLWQNALCQLEREQAQLLHLHLRGQISEELFCRENAIYQKEIARIQETLAHCLSFDALSSADRMEKITVYCEQILTGKLFAADFYGGILEKAVVQENKELSLYLVGFPHEIRYTP